MQPDIEKLLRTGPSVQTEGETPVAATKVVITLGPACQDVDTLCELLEAGAACARCDLTWGTPQFHAKSLANLQAAVQRTGKLCAVIVDTQGRECVANSQPRLDAASTPIYDRKLSVQPKDKVVLTTRAVAADSGNDWLVPISHPDFPGTCRVGETLVLGEYLSAGNERSSLHLTVADISATDIVCIAQGAAYLEGLLTIFPTGRKEAEGPQGTPLSESDVASLSDLAKEFEIDFLCLSFTQRATDVQEARTALASMGSAKTQVLAKLETGQALFQFHSIAAEADGVVLGRGKLGLDVRPEKMALIQKAIISNCNAVGKPVLVSRVLDSLAYANHASRAEVTDGSTAVLDGCDGFLLGAETARGKHPALAVREALNICQQAERCFDYRGHLEHMREEARAMKEEGQRAIEEVAASAVQLSQSCDARLIIVVPAPGMKTGLLSKYRPRVPVLNVVVPDPQTTDAAKWSQEGRGYARQCLLHSGLLPVLAQPSTPGEALLAEAVTTCLESNLLAPNNQVVAVQKGEDGFAAKVIVAGNVAKIVSRQPSQVLQDAQEVPAKPFAAGAPGWLENASTHLGAYDQAPSSRNVPTAGNPSFQQPQQANHHQPQLQDYHPSQPSQQAQQSTYHQPQPQNFNPSQPQAQRQDLGRPDNGGGQLHQQWEQSPQYGNGYGHQQAPAVQAQGQQRPPPAAFAPQPSNAASLPDWRLAPKPSQPYPQNAPAQDPYQTGPPQRFSSQQLAPAQNAGSAPHLQRFPSQPYRPHDAAPPPPQQQYATREGDGYRQERLVQQATGHQQQYPTREGEGYRQERPVQQANGHQQQYPTREGEGYRQERPVQQANGHQISFAGQQQTAAPYHPGFGERDGPNYRGPNPAEPSYPRETARQLPPQSYPSGGDPSAKAGKRESVLTLVERARSVINRRLEQYPTVEGQQLVQKAAPYATANGDRSVTPETQEAPPTSQVRGPDTPDTREQALGPPRPRSRNRFPDYQARQNQEQWRNPRSRRELDHNPPSPAPGIMRTAELGQYRSDPRIMNSVSDVEQYQANPRGRHSSGYAQDPRIYSTAGDLDNYRSDPRIMDSGGADSYLSLDVPRREQPTHAPTEARRADERDYNQGSLTPRNISAPYRGRALDPNARDDISSYPRGARLGSLEEAAVTLQQAREILGSLSRSSSMNDVRVRGDYDANGTRGPQKTSAGPQKEEGYGSGKPPGREALTPDKPHSDWFDTMDQRGRASRTSSGAFNGAEERPAATKRQTQAGPQKQDAGRHRGARERENVYRGSEQPATRASQATQAARVLHQAGLNLIHQANLAGAEKGEVVEGQGVPRLTGRPEDHEGLVPKGYFAGEASTLKGPGSQTLPETFTTNRQATNWQKIPRVVGGKVVPGLSPAAHSRLSLGRITRREAERKRWNPSGPAIPEGFVKHDPLPEASDQAYVGLTQPNSSSLRGPTSQSVAVADVQRQAGVQQQRQAAVEHHQEQRRASRDDSALDTKPQPQYNSSIMNSNPDIYLHKQERIARKAPHVQSGRPPVAPQVASQVPPQVAANVPVQRPAARPIRQQVAPNGGMARQPSTANSTGMTRQASAYTDPNMSRQSSYEGSLAETDIMNRSMRGEIRAGSAAGMSANMNLPAQTSTAEEVMRDYLVGEGIKKAHFRALHPKAPKKAKAGFFKSIFGKKEKSQG